MPCCLLDVDFMILLTFLPIIISPPYFVRNRLSITDTELKLMAAAAMIGLSNKNYLHFSIRECASYRVVTRFIFHDLSNFDFLIHYCFVTKTIFLRQKSQLPLLPKPPR